MDQPAVTANFAGTFFTPTTEPTPPSPKRGYNINIQPQDHGYLVHVGCKTICIETKEKLIEKVSAYIIDPVGTEKKFLDNNLFK